MGDIFFLVIFLPSLEFITVAHIMLEVLCTHLRKVLNNMFTLDVAWEVGKNLTHFFGKWSSLWLQWFLRFDVNIHWWVVENNPIRQLQHRNSRHAFSCFIHYLSAISAVKGVNCRLQTLWNYNAKSTFMQCFSYYTRHLSCMVYFFAN